MKHSLLNASPIPVLTSTTTTTTTTTNWVRPSFFRELFFSFWFTLGRFFQTLTNVSEHLPVRGKGLSELNLDASRIFTEFENSLKLDSTIFSSDYVLVLFFSISNFQGSVSEISGGSFEKREGSFATIWKKTSFKILFSDDRISNLW